MILFLNIYLEEDFISRIISIKKNYFQNIVISRIIIISKKKIISKILLYLELFPEKKNIFFYYN